MMNEKCGDAVVEEGNPSGTGENRRPKQELLGGLLVGLVLGQRSRNSA
jgi:hypothetical protein